MTHRGIAPIEPNELIIDMKTGRLTRAGFLHFNSINRLPTYEVGSLPTAALPGVLIFVANESGGAQPAFSDGTNWRRFTDRAVVS